MLWRRKSSLAITFRRILRLIAVASLLLLSNTLSVASAKEKHLTLVYAGNMPDIGISTYGTYSNIASLLEKLRAEKDPTIFAFGGGSLGPSPLSSLDKGSHIIDILNTLEPDLMALTKRDFSYFEDELTLRSYEAAFPIVCGNIYDPLITGNLEGVLPTHIAEKGNIKVGFISILDEEVVEEYLLKRAVVFEPRKIIQQQIEQLKQQGAELIVLLFAKERDYYHTLISDNQIDFALRMAPSSLDADKLVPVNNVYPVTRKSPFIKLKISWQSNALNKNLKIETPTINLSSLSEHPTTSLLINNYNQRLNRLLSQQIGVWGTEIQTLRRLVRTQETPFGNLIADSLRHYAKTDIAVVNGGDIRGDKAYKKGSSITRRDIATELPFRSSLTIMKVTGDKVKQALEHSVSTVENIRGRFLQVSGLTFTYVLEKPAYERIKTVSINGIPLSPTKTYTVAASSYLANGGDGYDVFLNSLHQKQNTQSAPLLADIVTRMIQQQQILTPKIEFRIKRVPE